MNNKHKNLADTQAFAQAVAEKQHWVLNPEPDFTGKILEGLCQNYNRFGYYLCPCRDGDGERNRDKDIVCPCDYAKADIQDYGHCFCALYLSPSYEKQVKDGKELSSIPERRPEELFS